MNDQKMSEHVLDESHGATSTASLWAKRCLDLVIAIEAMAEEREKLRGALKQIASCETRFPGDVVSIARAALAQWSDDSNEPAAISSVARDVIIEPPSKCSACGQDANPILLCDVTDGAWCSDCFDDATNCERDHGEGCHTVVFQNEEPTP